MTSKRKAEIQRKLSLTAVPRPPDDLLDRIKGDIPRYLNVEAERERFSRSVAFNLRIAASIIVLISIAGLLYLMNPDEPPYQIPSIALRAKRAEAPKPLAAPPPRVAMDEVQVDILQTASAPDARAESAPVSAPAEPPVQRAVRREREMRAEEVVAGIEGNAMGGVVGGIVGGTAGGIVGVPADDEQTNAVAPQQLAEAAPAVAPAPVPVPVPEPAPAPPMVAPPAPPAVGGRERAAQRPAAVAAAPPSSSSLVPNAYADELRLAPKSVFGISVDPSVFRRIKTTIESGARPSPASVDVEALVNYFAGAPAKRVKSGVRLEVEGSPVPVDGNGRRGVLRLTIDTATIAVPQGGSVPPIGTDARLEIEFNRDAVESYEAVGDNATLLAESALLHNTSVTGLYALELRTPLNATQRVAKVVLRYRSVADGKQHTITRELRGSDFAEPWTKASRRHRLASLGALWGESLRSSHGGTDVARRAEELASQEPNDTRARELAEVAAASGGGAQ